MIDILFILLVFFIVSTSFKQPRKVLEIDLPRAEEIPSKTVTDSRSVLAVDAEGNISLDALRVPEDLLGGYLAAFKSQNPGRKLELEADRRLPLEILLKVWEVLEAQGFSIKDVPARIRGQ